MKTITFENNIGFIKIGKTKKRPIYRNYVGAYYLKQNKDKIYISQDKISKARAKVSLI